MKIGEYNQMMAYLTRKSFKEGTPDTSKPKPKPLTEDFFKEKADLYIKGLIGGFPQDEMLLKLQGILDKAVEQGLVKPEEGVNYFRNRKQELLDFAKENPGQTLPELTRENFAIGGGIIEGENLGTREGFGAPEAKKYLESLDPGTTVNTYEIGKKFDTSPGTVRGQVQRNFPELNLQTKEEAAAKAKDVRRAQYTQKKSDVPIIQSEVRGSGKQARTKGRNITGVTFPTEEQENKYIKYLEDRYSDVKGRKGPSNAELAVEFYGESTPANIAKIEKINQYFKKNLKLDFKPAPEDEVSKKRKRRLDIVQGGRSLKGTDEVPFHHIMNIGGEVPLTTKDVAFITKKMNSDLAPYNTRLNDIADAISNQLNNQEPGYLKRIDELNNQAEQIIEGVKTKLPKKYQGYIGFNRLDPILDEYGTPVRLNVTRVGVDDSKSLAGKKGSAIPLETLTQSKIDQFNTKVDQTFNKMTEVFKDPKFKSVLQNSGLTLRSLGQLRQRNIPGFIDTMKKLINKNPELRAELGNDYADIENMYASAATMSDVSPVKKETNTGIPEEAIATGTVGAVRYGPQLLNLLKNVGAQTIKPIVSPLAAATFAGSELYNINPFSENFGQYKEDGSLSAAGMQMFYPEIFKQFGSKLKSAQGVYDRLLNLGFPVKDAAKVARGFTGLGSLMIGGDIVSGLKERIGPSQRGPLTEQELLEMRGKETYMGNIADTFDKAYQTRTNFAEGPEDPSKRKFMKIMGGLASLPIVGRFFDVAQVAEKAAPAVVETFKNAPAHFVGLVNKIRALGKIVEPEKLMPSDQKRYSNVYDYGDYRMYEGKDGQIEIAKDRFMATDYGDAKVSEEYMSYNPKSPKYNKKGELTGETEPQYDEYTAYADQDGKMKDVYDGVEPNTMDDGIYSKEELEQLIIEQIENDLKKGKK